jgi:hypothetical protein
LCRGVPKKRQKKATSTNTETSLVLANPTSSVMQFPSNEAVEKAREKKKNKKTTTTSGGAAKKRKVTAATTSGGPSNRYNLDHLSVFPCIY